MTDVVSHSWLQQNIRPIMAIVCLLAFTMGVTGITKMVRGDTLSETELQIIWSVLGLYTIGRSAEKGIAIRKNGGQ